MSTGIDFFAQTEEEAIIAEKTKGAPEESSVSEQRVEDTLNLASVLNSGKVIIFLQGYILYKILRFGLGWLLGET